MSILGIQNALMGNDPEKLKIFLERNSSLANTPFSVNPGQLIRPLEFALAFTKNIELVEILLKYGADPNYITSYGPLLNQSHENEVTNLLLKHGANPNLIFDDISPLDNAIWGKNYEKAKLLISYGANPFKSDGTGRSVLSQKLYELNKVKDDKIEFELFQQAEVKYLGRWEELKQAILSEDFKKIQNEIINNFDVVFIDSNGLSPYQYALNNGKPEIAELFKTKQKEKKQKGGCLGIFFILMIILSFLATNL